MPPSRWERLRAQGAAWNAERAEHGPRHATVLRIRYLLDLGPVTSGRVNLMTAEIDELRVRAERLEVSPPNEVPLAHSPLADAPSLVADVWRVTTWLETVAVSEDVLVTVVMPTRGERHERLVSAVDSVLAQHHPNWQLVIAVDGDDRTMSQMSSFLPDDQRIELVRSARSGPAAARNAALDVARGDLIAYLDDDNYMGPAWLKAVVWAAAQNPRVELFYGAELIDEPQERGFPASHVPELYQRSFDRRVLEHANCIDQNVVAHRRELAGARYDESLPALVDWDFLLRVTVDHEPLPIPVVAACYTTDAPDRVSRGPDVMRTEALLRARSRRHAPLRVLALNQLHPLITETYIADDLDALASQGAAIACCVIDNRVAPAATPFQLYHEPIEAVARHDPDVVFIHWAVYARDIQPLLHTLGRPYGVRAHSFAAEVDAMRELVEDPLCIGIWCFDQQAFEHPKVHSLPIAFSAHEDLPPPAEARDLLLSVSATLPKKDFGFIVDVLAEFPDVDRRIVIGTTSGHEDLVTELIRRAGVLPDPPLVQMNLTRPQVFELYARASALIYNVTPQAGFGCPMSVVEAMTAGVVVLLPDRPEVPVVFGPSARRFTSKSDLVRQLSEVLRGGPRVEAERQQCREWALAHFCDPEIPKRLYSELSDATETALAAG